MTDLNAYLERTRRLVDEALKRAFPTPAASPALLEAMQYSLLAGGKRIRPALAFASCEAVDSPAENAIPVAAALEMIHTYSLIHDDLPAMDDDDFRRGRPTNHKVFGDALAILAGDGLLTHAFSVLSDPLWRIPAETQVEIVRILADAAGCDGMVAGQVLDLQAEGTDFTERTLLQIHTHKTGKILLASVLAGGRAGGAGSESMRRLNTYGQAVGLAFQIADDVLDLTATTEEMGKPPKSDLKRKKATYPSLLGIEESRLRAGDLLHKALDAVAPFGPKGETLAALARFIVERKS